ncbi:putative serpin-Z6A [Miscanthus floridulus]|uniref:putative serpin-Z6A n=1 Tax=Miscanthus floridulus TaxID=154761 RepID=UPI00345839C2
MKRMSEDLRGCMLSTKEALDTVLAEAGPIPSGALPEADAGAFTEWLRAKVGLMVPIISHVGDFGAFVVALGVTRSFQHTGYNHAPALGRPPHRFSSVDEVRWSDEACQNIVKQFVSKFWMKGGRVLAAEKAAASWAELNASAGGGSSETKAVSVPSALGDSLGAHGSWEALVSNAASLTALALCFTRQLQAPPDVTGEPGGPTAAVNLVFSPVPVYAALALLAAGARGGTLQELLDALGGDSRDDLAAFARRATERAHADRSRSGGPAVAFACGASHDPAWALLPAFRDAAAASYNAEAHAVDFSNEPEKAVGEINGCLAAATNKHIDSILDPSSVNTLTSLVLSSAICFRGRWEAPFAKAHTVVDKFHRLDGSNADVPFMYSVHSQYIAIRNGYKVLKLPYRSPAPARAPAPRKGSSSQSNVGDDPAPKYSMCIFQPNERDGLPGLIEMSSGPGFSHYLRLLTLHVPVGDFRLPKFKLSASGSVRQVLRNGMGINSVFVAGEADLDDMAAKHDEDAAGRPLYVADVCHKAVLEVNEGGTVAIGATASYMLCGASAIMDQPVKVDFVADHPFVFFLIQEVSRAIIFVGRVLDPSISA